MIKESCNLIGQEAEMDTSNEKCYLPLMVISMKEKTEYWLIPSREIDGQRILEFDWLREF